MPTKSPTSSPTETKWYPDRNPNYSEGRCITVVPIPQFRETYSTLEECCESSYRGQSSGACLSNGETTTTSTSSFETTSSSSTLQYYSSPSDGMCAIVDGKTPSWITTFFIDWTECCKAGWKFDECIAAAPFNLAEEDTEDEESTSTTTSTTSSSTTIMQFYSSPSDGMCAIVDGDTPSWINTFFTDWSECCKAGWKYDECMAAAPAVLIEDPTTTTTTSSSATSTETACQSALWHPVTASEQICTNSLSYPPTWNDSELRDQYLFKSAKACCKKLYQGSSCEIVDICK